jgi:hypothetical protein
MAPRQPERDVLGNLPRTRPTRRSSERAAPAQDAAATRPGPPRSPAAARKPTRPRVRAAAAKAPPPAPPPPVAGYATPRQAPNAGERRHHGLLGTAVQAAGELAELGLAVGAQAVRGALGRLPRP